MFTWTVWINSSYYKSRWPPTVGRWVGPALPDWKRPAGVLVTCQSALGQGQIWKSSTVRTEHYMPQKPHQKPAFRPHWRQEVVSTDWHLCMLAGADYSSKLVMLFKEREVRGFNSFTEHNVWPISTYTSMMDYFLWSPRAEIIQISFSGRTLHRGKEKKRGRRTGMWRDAALCSRQARW